MLGAQLQLEVGCRMGVERGLFALSSNGPLLGARLRAWDEPGIRIWMLLVGLSGIFSVIG